MTTKPLESSPEIQPILKWTVQPPDSPPRALGFKLPAIPGIPDPESALAAGLRTCSGEPAFIDLSPREAEVALCSLAEALCRERYHKQRFDECLRHVKARRQALGGPSVADWQAVVPLINEAIALLGAARTALDILVYIAARESPRAARTVGKPATPSLPRSSPATCRRAASTFRKSWPYAPVNHGSTS